MRAHQIVTGLSVLALAWVSGCTSPAAHYGRVAGGAGGQGEKLRPNVGERFLDFTYIDDEGKTQRLKDHLGDYTFLIFTKCGDEMHSMASKEIRDLVHASSDREFNEIVAFDVYWSESGCEGEDPCRLTEQDSSFFSICDARGEVANLYGVGHLNEVLVIGPDGRIVDGASVVSLDELKARIKERIDKYTDRKREYLTQVMY